MLEQEIRPNPIVGPNTTANVRGYLGQYSARNNAKDIREWLEQFDDDTKISLHGYRGRWYLNAPVRLTPEQKIVTRNAR